MSDPRTPKLSIIYFTVFVDLIGFGIIIPILPLYAKELGTTFGQNGWLLGIYSLVQLVSSPLLGRISDRAGRRPVLLLSILGGAAGYFLMGWAESVALLFAARVIQGFTGGNISTAQAYIADVTTQEERSRAMAVVGACFGLGFIIGPAIAGWMSAISMGAPFYFAGCLSLFNSLLIYAFLPESLKEPVKQHEKLSFTEVFRSSPKFSLVTASYFFVIMGFSVMTANYTLFTEHQFGFNASENGYLFAYIGLILTLMQGAVVRRVLKGHNDRPAALFGGLVLLIGLVALPYSGGLPGLLLASGLISAGYSFISPALMGLASKLADARAQGRAIGVLQGGASLGRFVGPVLGGWLLSFDAHSHFGRLSFFAAAAILGLAVCLIWQLPGPSEKL